MTWLPRSTPQTRRPYWFQRALPLLAMASAALALAFLPACQQARESSQVAASGEAGSQSDPLADPSRSDDDRKRDQGFKPLEVYSFFDVQPGLTVADLWPGRGYHTQILSKVVGQEGEILAVMGPLYYGSSYADRAREALGERIEAGKLENVRIVDQLEDLAPDSIDVMITVRNYHDLGGAPERTAVLPALMKALKPGGILGVVDAYTPKEGVDDDNHRMNEELAIAEFTANGFELVERSDVLVNPDDTYEFDGREDDAPIHRYFIHRFVHKYRKPVE